MVLVGSCTVDIADDTTWLEAVLLGISSENGPAKSYGSRML